MNSFSQFALQLIIGNLQFIVDMIQIVARFIGIGLVIVGMTRLYRAGGGQSMMHRVSPMATFMYFLVGTVFMAYTPFITIFSNSLFGTNGEEAFSSQYINNRLSYDAYPTGACDDIVTTDKGYKDTNPFCPMLRYAQDIKLPGKDGIEDYTSIATTVTYAILFVVGVIAFLRGLSLLIKVGDGGQGGTLSKAVTHIIAGLVGVNAPAIYSLLEGIYSGLLPS